MQGGDFGEEEATARIETAAELWGRDYFSFSVRGFGCEESGELRDDNDVAFRRLVKKKKWMRCPAVGISSNCWRAIGLLNAGLSLSLGL
ncbi:hypothetical protein C2S52_007234 [Perilla frutescens var. hirtella]|nr:hypothetical protein C2S52_007234 [Perilla frutescens var. hirtella]